MRADWILILGTVLSAGTVSAQSSNWPQWRGPSRNGVSAEGGLPVEWSATKNILWKTAIEGKGHSSPVVWGDRLFLTTDIEAEVIPGKKAPRHIRAGEDLPASGF